MTQKISYGVEHDLNLRVLISLSRATQALHRRSAVVFKRNGLTLAQFAVLEALYHKGPLTINQIIRSILATGGNMTVVICNLEKLGLVERCPNPQDKRSSVISLTQQGTTLVEGIFPQHLADLEDYFQTLSVEEKGTLIGILQKLSRSRQPNKE